MLPSFLKSMDRAEGRRIATRAMLPALEDLIMEEKDSSAWTALEIIRNLASCMTDSFVEENGHCSKNVPISYDFKEVSENKHLTFTHS